MPLTARQKAKILKANPGNIVVVMLMRKFEVEYNQKIKDLEEEFNEKLERMRQQALDTFASVRRMQKGDKPIAGVDYFIPKDGRHGIDGSTPTRQDLIDLIRPLIPKVRDGETPTREELIDLIRPLVPRETDEKALMKRILSETPTAEAIADIVLEKLKEKKITIDEVEGLQNFLNALNRNIAELKVRKLKGGGGGGMGNWVHEVFNTTSATTSVTVARGIAAEGNAVLVRYQGQMLAHGQQYTVSGKVITFTFTLADSTFVDVTYVRS